MLATIPSDLKLILTDVEVRNTADGSGINFDILIAQCSNDVTFQYEDISANDVKQFSFEMFEFTSTANAPVSGLSILPAVSIVHIIPHPTYNPLTLVCRRVILYLYVAHA